MQKNSILVVIDKNNWQRAAAACQVLGGIRGAQIISSDFNNCLNILRDEGRDLSLCVETRIQDIGPTRPLLCLLAQDYAPLAEVILMVSGPEHAQECERTLETYGLNATVVAFGSRDWADRLLAAAKECLRRAHSFPPPLPGPVLQVV